MPYYVVHIVCYGILLQYGILRDPIMPDLYFVIEQDCGLEIGKMYLSSQCVASATCCELIDQNSINEALLSLYFFFHGALNKTHE